MAAQARSQRGDRHRAARTRRPRRRPARPAGNGFGAYHQLRHAALLDSYSAIVATPGGGLHVYLTGSAQPSGRLPRHHLDFKARGGYVLAPPSRVNGKPYRLITRQPQSGGLDWRAVTSLLEPEPKRLIRPGGSCSRDLGQLAAWVERLAEGNRNSGLFWAACRAVESGQAGSLADLAAAASRTGLSDREIARTIASARRASQHTAGRQAEREGTP